MFNFMDRYKLWNCAAFKDDGGGGGDSGGGGSDDKPQPQAKTIGQVSKTGQYAGDGFEFVENEGGYLTRTYTGAGKDNGLGTDVFHAPTSGDDNVRNAVAQISLNEGSEFAGTQASATDTSVLNLIRSDEDKVGSSSFAEQSGVENYTPTITYGDDTPTPPTPQAKTFGEEFAEARAAGQDTFTYNGNLYTTELAPEITAPASTAPVNYFDAFGNEYTSQAEAAEADNLAAQQAATANDIVRGTEESLFEQPVVTADSQAYLDELGTDFDFTQFDTPSIDYTVSQGEAGRGGDDTAAPTFSYESGVDPAKEILVNLKNTAPETLTAGEYLQATQYEKEQADAAPEPGVSVVSPITASDVSATATNPRLGYESGQDVLQSSADYLTGLDGSGPNTTGQVTDAFYGGEGAPVSAAVAMQDAAELAEMAEKKPLSESILDALAANSPLDKAIGTDFMAPYAANIPVGVVQGIGALTSGLGQTIDQLTGTNQTNLALERMREAGPMSAAQEEAFIRAAAEEGLRMRDTALKPRDETFYQAGSAPFDYAQEVMKPYYEETIPGYEGRENIYKNMATYEDVVGFEPGQIDRQLLDAAQAKQSDLEKLVFGQGPGSAVRMDGSGFDPSTAAQKSIEGAGSTAPLLGLSLMGPLGTAAAIAGGQQSVAGELSQETDAALQGLYETGRLQNSDRFKQLVAANEGDEAAALKRMQQDARDLSQMPSAVLGGGATAVEAALLRMGLPGAAAIPIVEGLQEGPGESIAANQILQTVTGFGLPVNRRETLESGTAGIGGGATVAVPVSGAQAFVPTGPRAGQPAASTVPTEYSDSLIDTGMGGVGDVASDASSMEVMAAEKIIEDQVASTGTVDPKVAENLKDRTGLSSEEINNMAEKAGGTGPFVLTPEMRVQEGAFQLTEDMRVQEPPLQLTEDMRVDVPAAETPVDLSGIPSRLTLTGAESLGPTTPDLSGIASNLNLGLPQTPAIPADPATPVLQKNGVATTYGDALANETVTATQQLENARITGEYTPAGATFEEQLANMDQDIKNLADQLVAENYTMPTDAVTSKMDADAAATNQTAGFTTARGSTYTVNSDGTTTRTRAPDEEGGSFVEQPTSGKTIFMSKEDMNKFGPLFQQGELGMYKFVPIKGTTDQAQLVQAQDYGPFKAGDPVEGTQVTFSTTPEVGQHPVEIYDSTNKTGNDIHFGSEITELTGETSETPVFTSVRETTETPVFTSVRGGIPAAADAAITSKMDADAAATQAKTEDLAATQEEDVAAVIDLPEEFQEQLELPLESDQTKTLAEDQTKTLAEDQTKTLEDDQTKTLEDDQTKTLEDDQTKTLEEDQTSTIVSVPVITQVTEPGEDEEVEVELEPEEPEVEPEPEVEVDPEIDVLVPPITSTDDDGNTVTECPEGYEMVQTADGPMCQKSVSSTRQRAGASTRAYTGLSGNVGRRGPGQRRKTTTSTERVRPTIRSA